LDIFGLQIDPLLLFAIILGAIGTLGTALTVVSNAQQIWQRFRAKSEERESKVKKLLEKLIGPISTFALSLTRENYSLGLGTFLVGFRPFKDEILGSKAVLDKEVPNISSNLTALIDRVEKDTHGQWSVGAMVGLPEDSNFRKLISSLNTEISVWLQEHA
jgi:hypothetical protein